MGGYILEVGFKWALYIYFLLYDWRMLVIYWSIVAVHTVIHYCIRDESTNLNRLKIRLATWDSPTDSNCYVKMVVPVGPWEKYAAKKLKEDGTKVTLTHVALKSVGHAMSRVPGTNGKITFGKFSQFPTVDVNTLIDMDGSDLAQITVTNTDGKSIKEMSDETRDIVRKIKSKKNTDHKERTKAFDYMPDWMVSIALQVGAFLSYNMGMAVPALKMKKHGMGSFLLTNVSSLNFKEAYAPLCNFTRNAATCVLCTPHWQWQLDENGQNGKSVKVCNFMWTCDHRFIDGAAGSKLIDGVTEVFERPERF